MAFTASLTAQDPNIERIRQRIREDIMAPSVNAAAINKIINTQKPDGTWGDINYIDTSRTGFHHRVHLQRLEDMSRAYRKQGSPLYGNVQLKQSIDKALNHWLAKDYICANWWWNEIGTPEHISNTLFILEEEITPEQRAKALKIASRCSMDSGVGPRPGGDFIKIAGMVGKRALYLRDVKLVERIITFISGEIKISTERGLRPDMSFHHRTDGVISTLSYGMAYPAVFAYWNKQIAGTRFKFPESSMKLLVDYFVDGISKSMAFAKYPDMAARNRDLTREGSGHGESNPKLAENILAGTTYRKEELQQIIASQKGNGKPTFEWNRFFPHSEYYTHQRPTWFSSVRMHSIRQNNVEFPYNEEGLQNHHITDGASYITLTGKEYDGTAPVWDWQKIPGTTVLQKDSLPHWNQIVKKGKSTHVGAVGNGIIGAASMHLISVHDPLEAKKAWFHFKDGYVCLGAGIQTTDKHIAATTLNQSSLDGEVVVKTRNQMQTLPKGTRILDQPNWIHHANVFYFLPQGGAIRLKNDWSYGNWRSINHQEWATYDTVKKQIFMAWFEHESNKAISSYAYTVVPETLSQREKAESVAAGLQIRANNASVQAVYDRSGDVLQAVFYESASLETTGITGTINVEVPVMLMIEGVSGKHPLILHVADPFRKRTSIRLSLSGKHTFGEDKIISKWDSKTNRTTIEVMLPNGLYAGNTASFKATK
jgi:chondroitin AC lyase